MWTLLQQVLLSKATTGHVSKILAEAMRIFVPPFEILATLSAPDIQKRREKAIRFFCAEIDVCLLHLRGDHSLCKHGASSKKEEKFFCCEAQVVALRDYFLEMKKKAPELLSLAGRVHIQHCESNNAQVARIRPKNDDTLSEVGNFLAETIGFLNIMELQLGFHGKGFSYLEHISEDALSHIGIDIRVDCRSRKRKENARNARGSEGQAYASCC